MPSFAYQGVLALATYAAHEHSFPFPIFSEPQLFRQWLAKESAVEIYPEAGKLALR